MAQLIASRYELGPMLGAGGMAQVVRGRDTRLDRPVAIKLIPASAIDPVGRERFGREARSSAGFAHPNAVMAFDAGESDGYLYLVMELVDGSSLAERLAHSGPLPIDQAVHIEDSILAALGAAHAAGIVHRDVKPGNVLLGERGRVKLADFGIARRLDDLTSDLTGVGRFIGTPKYLAPEQLAGESATPASDLYAAGVVLYEMLAGAPPFDGPSPMELAWAHHHAPVPDVRAVRPDAPDHLAATITTAMAKDPADRFATADAMRRALAPPAAAVQPQPALSSAPVLPPTIVAPTTVSSSGRPPPSRRWLWVAAIAALLAIVVGAVALGRRDDDTADPPSTTVEPQTTVAAPTTVAAAEPTTPPTTAPPTATASPTTAVPPPSAAPATAAPPVVPILPDSLPALITALGLDPDLYGTRTADLADDLAEVDGRPDRARRVLDRAEQWVQDGELAPELLPLLQQLLGGLAAEDQPGGGTGGGDDDEGDGNGNGNNGDGNNGDGNRGNGNSGNGGGDG